MSYNPYTFPRLPRAILTETFESSERFDESGTPARITVSLRKLDGPDSALMTEKWQEAELLYVTGEHPDCEGGVRLEFPGLESDEQDKLNKITLQNAASIWAMQADGPNRHSFETFVGACFRDESVYNQLCKFANDVNVGKAVSSEDSESAVDSSGQSSKPRANTRK